MAGRLARMRKANGLGRGARVLSDGQGAAKRKPEHRHRKDSPRHKKSFRSVDRSFR